MCYGADLRVTVSIGKKSPSGETLMSNVHETYLVG